MKYQVKYQAVIFDLFGTLVHGFSVRSMDDAMSRMADILKAPRGEFKQRWSDTNNARQTGVFPSLEANVAHVCAELELDVDAGCIADAAALNTLLSERSFVARDDAVATLAGLRKMGLKIGLISDTGPATPDLWKRSSLAPLVDFPVFSSRVGIKKPDPRIYRLACDGLSVTPGQCLYVGDGGSRELTGALNVGMTPVQIGPPDAQPQAVLQIDGEEWDGAKVATLSEVLALVDSVDTTLSTV